MIMVGASIPSPSKVKDVAQQEVQHARTHDGSVADSLAQTVKKTPVGTGDRLTIWAGGFWNQVSADEYPDQRLRRNGQADLAGRTVHVLLSDMPALVPSIC